MREGLLKAISILEYCVDVRPSLIQLLEDELNALPDDIVLECPVSDDNISVILESDLAPGLLEAARIAQQALKEISGNTKQTDLEQFKQFFDSMGVKYVHVKVDADCIAIRDQNIIFKDNGELEYPEKRKS